MDLEEEIKEIGKDLRQKIDTNKDGRLDFKEITTYGLETLKSTGISLFFAFLGGAFLTALIMLLRGVIMIDVFYILCQILAPSGLLKLS